MIVLKYNLFKAIFAHLIRLRDTSTIGSHGAQVLIFMFIFFIHGTLLDNAFNGKSTHCVV